MISEFLIISFLVINQMAESQAGFTPCTASVKMKDRKGNEVPYKAVSDALLMMEMSDIVSDRCSTIENYINTRNYTLERCINKKSSSTKVFVAEGMNDGSAVVSFAGSGDVYDWIVTNANKRFKAIDNHKLCTIFNPKNRCVHNGFLNALSSVLSTLKDETKPYFEKGKQVYITGFSLGGALATLFSYKLARNNPDYRDQINLFAFGAPPVGNKAFVKKFKSMDIRSHYEITVIGDEISYTRCAIPGIMKMDGYQVPHKDYLPKKGNHKDDQYRHQLEKIQTKEGYLKAYNLDEISANEFEKAGTTLAIDGDEKDGSMLPIQAVNN